MKDKDIDTIAKAIAAKIGEPAGNKLLGCGSASSSEYYYCSTTYSCSSYYECGGAADFHCWTFTCDTDFSCDNGFVCLDSFDCEASYTED